MKKNFKCSMARKQESLNRDSVTKKEFDAYVDVQMSGDYNMIVDAGDAMDMAGLSEETYYTIQHNYRYLKDKFSKTGLNKDEQYGDFIYRVQKYDMNKEEEIEGGDPHDFHFPNSAIQYAKNHLDELAQDEVFGIYEMEESEDGTLECCGILDVVGNNTNAPVKESLIKRLRRIYHK